MKQAADLLLGYAVRYLAEEEGAADHDPDDFHDDHASHDADFLIEESHEDHSLDSSSSSSSSSKPWGEVVAAAFLINLATFSGLLITVFFVVIPRRIHQYRTKKQQQRSNVHISSVGGVLEERANNSEASSLEAAPVEKFVFSHRVDSLILPAFAAGALLATVVFLIVPESISMLQGDEDSHDEGGGEDDHEGHGRRRHLEVFQDVAQMAGREMWRRMRSLQEQEDHDDHDHDDTDADEDHDEHADEHMLHNETAFTNMTATTVAMEQSDGQEGHEDNYSAVAWKFGVALMAGYLFPLLMQSLCHVPKTQEEESESGTSGKRLDMKCHKEETKLLLTPVNDLLEDIVDEVDVDEMIMIRHQKIKGGKAVILSTDDDEEAPLSAEDSMNTESNTNQKTTNTIARVSFVPGVHEAKDGAKDRPSLAKRSSITSLLSLNSQHGCSDSKPVEKNWSLVLTILLGDGFHNFTDGIFVGNAFMFCNRDLAYAVVAATLYHEFAQEVADFCLLTQQCHLSTVQALVLNFLSGFSVMIGALLILAIDMSVESTGVVLAVSGGVYIYIAGTEIIPRIFANPSNAGIKSQAIFLLCFAIGAVPIGLVLLNHTHEC